jgi:hypothetical protein
MSQPRFLFGDIPPNPRLQRTRMPAPLSGKAVGHTAETAGVRWPIAFLFLVVSVSGCTFHSVRPDETVPIRTRQNQFVGVRVEVSAADLEEPTRPNR